MVKFLFRPRRKKNTIPNFLSCEPFSSRSNGLPNSYVKKTLRLRFFVALLIVAASARVWAQSASPAVDVKNTEPIVHALCGKRVALLGESPIHGFGETLEFKAKLVRQLVEQCHYNALFIESGIYDYINLEKKLKSGQDVTDTMISTAIGGLWANREVQSLVPFLREKCWPASRARRTG